MINRTPRQQRLWKFVTAASMTAALAVSGCSSSSSGGESDSSETTSEYAIVPDAEVTAGLAKVRTMAAEIKSLVATDKKAAEARFTELHEVWEEVEGTIKKNDKNSYLNIEDAMGEIKGGVQSDKADRVERGVTDLSTAMDTYLKAHP